MVPPKSKDYQLSIIKFAIENKIMPGYATYEEFLDEMKKTEENSENVNVNIYAASLSRTGEFSLKDYSSSSK